MTEDMFHIAELLPPPGELPDLPEQFLKAFKPDPEPDIPDEPATFDEITELTRQELGRRLRNRKLRDELPATGLFNIMLAEEKAKDRELEARKNREVQTERGNAVDVILNLNLSPERKRSLLEAERERMEIEYARLVQLLAEDTDGPDAA